MSRATNNRELAQSGVDTWPNCVSKSGKKSTSRKNILTSRATDYIKKWGVGPIGIELWPNCVCR